ncbi:hypothetical protein [Terracidiphilus gabretensis]|uniref:hypothetical protein n=1 Tax=Terracidiphilus gabretensis TaxID=1577687 RepID=UPI0012F96EA6|nr:hypothetical protein [Terracidiphilus gabretensis]
MRLELDNVAVRLNLLGQPGEQPDYIVATWVLPYVYALRGDRDWRRVPQLTGSRQVSPLAIQAYKRLEQGEANISELKTILGQGVTEVAVLRAITELWQQLRIIPVIAAPGKAAKWQLLRVRFQKAIAEGASTSQVTAISVLASIFLQAVIAASMEEVELFLAALTARSKIREVLRGLVATRQVHTLSMGHAPHFYVAGTLPEFSVAPQIYASATLGGYGYGASGYSGSYGNGYRSGGGGYYGREEELEDSHVEPVETVSAGREEESAVRNGGAKNKNGARPHFSRNGHGSSGHGAAHAAGTRKPGATTSRARSAESRPAKSAGSKTASSNGHVRSGSSRPASSNRPGSSRPGSSRTTTSAKPASAVRRGGLSRTAAGAAGPRRKPALAGSSFRGKQGTKKRG